MLMTNSQLENCTNTRLHDSLVFCKTFQGARSQKLLEIVKNTNELEGLNNKDYDCIYCLFNNKKKRFKFLVLGPGARRTFWFSSRTQVG